MFIKRGDGKILSVVDDKDEEAKKSAKEASDKIQPLKNNTDQSKKSGG